MTRWTGTKAMKALTHLRAVTVTATGMVALCTLAACGGAPSTVKYLTLPA